MDSKESEHDINGIDIDVPDSSGDLVERVAAEAKEYVDDGMSSSYSFEDEQVIPIHPPTSRLNYSIVDTTGDEGVTEDTLNGVADIMYSSSEGAENPLENTIVPGAIPGTINEETRDAIEQKLKELSIKSKLSLLTTIRDTQMDLDSSGNEETLYRVPTIAISNENNEKIVRVRRTDSLQSIFSGISSSRYSTDGLPLSTTGTSPRSNATMTVPATSPRSDSATANEGSFRTVTINDIPEFKADEEAGLKIEKDRHVHQRNNFIATLYIITIIIIIISWIYKIVSSTAEDGNLYRLIWLVFIPYTFCVLLYPCYIFIGGLVNMIGPIDFIQHDSKYYSCIKPPEFETDYPRVTIQIPVYTENFKNVIRPTLESIIKCRDTYKYKDDMPEMDINIIVSDDGLQFLNEEDANERIKFYEENDIGYVARPRTNRRGRFKKASNMNYTYAVSKIFDKMLLDSSQPVTNKLLREIGLRLSAQLTDVNSPTIIGGDIRFGEYIKISDADGRIPSDSLHDVIREFKLQPKLGFTQHLTYPLNITGSMWENFICHFTTIIYEYGVLVASAGGDAAPMMGHNLVIRKDAMENTIKQKDVTIDDFRNGNYTYQTPWSETNVSEDFKLFLDMMCHNYYGRYVTYTGNDFIEGVSLSYMDELIKFKKYAYGTYELIFNPIENWFCTRNSCCKGPINKYITYYLFSDAEFSSKMDLLAYLFTYVVFAVGLILTYLNYFLYGWYPQILDTVIPSLNILIQIFALFSGWGLLAHSIMKARILHKDMCGIFWDNVSKIPSYMMFFGSLQYHMLTTLIVYMCGKRNVNWGATSKEVVYKNRWDSFKGTIKAYWDMYIVFTLTLIMIIILWLPIWPDGWRITSMDGVIPLLASTIFHLIAPILLNPFIVSNNKMKNVTSS